MKRLGMGMLIALVATGAVLAEGQNEGGAGYPRGALDFVAPGGAGGGWDLTIRTTANVLADSGLVAAPMPVRNNPGAGGSVHLASLQERPDADNIITVYSPPLILTQLAGTSEFGYQDVTPLARLIADYAVFVVREDSPYRTLGDVMAALESDIKSVKIGGTSSAGSMDHLQFLIMARAAGIDGLRDIDYVSFDDGGSAMVMGGHIDIFSTGLSEVRGLIESGDLRALAQSAPHRVGTGVVAEIPTAQEQGIDATFVNWRGLFGPPAMPDYAVQYWRDTLAQMVQTSEWGDARQTNGWDDAYMDGPEFGAFLAEVDTEYRTILAEIGMLAN